MKYTVVAENDITQWADDTGKRYHFPRRYRRLLEPGTRLIHYKGRRTDMSVGVVRLSPDPHYFAFSIAGAISEDGESSKGDLFVDIVDYRRFDNPVPIRINGELLEQIPESRAKNFWRDGVRSASDALFNNVAQLAGFVVPTDIVIGPNAATSDNMSTAGMEGARLEYLSSRLERSPTLRKKAYEIHGARCFACEIEMGKFYGSFADGFVHIHHKRQLSSFSEPSLVDPLNDLVPLCPNCHSIVHLGGKLRTVNEVRANLGKPAIKFGD